MTTNTQTGSLPDTFKEQLQNSPDFAMLVADRTLSRRDIHARILESVGVDATVGIDGCLQHEGYAELVCAIDPDEDRDVRLVAKQTKMTLAQRATDLVGADVDVSPDQDALRKDQLLRFWLAVEYDVIIETGSGDEDSTTHGLGRTPVVNP